MRIKDVFAAAVAVVLSAGPAIAQSTARASAPLDETSSMGGSGLLIIALVVALGIGVRPGSRNGRSLTFIVLFVKWTGARSWLSS